MIGVRCSKRFVLTVTETPSFNSYCAHASVFILFPSCQYATQNLINYHSQMHNAEWLHNGMLLLLIIPQWHLIISLPTTCEGVFTLVAMDNPYIVHACH